MIFRYQSGEEVEKGDRVLFHGDPGFVESIADPDVKEGSDPDTAWHLSEHGGGILLRLPGTFGRVFLPTRVFTNHESNYDDLKLVSRVQVGSEPHN